MGTARTSPKVVRERRAKGIPSNRGRVRRHFPKAHRNDRHLETVAQEAKSWTPDVDPLQIAADRIVSLADPPSAVKEDVTQEVWVQLLEGRSEEAIQESLAVVIKEAKEIEMGGRHISLDAPMSSTGDGALTVGDFVDTEGRYHRTKDRVHPKKRMDRCGCGRPCSIGTIRCRACVQAERELLGEIRRAERELSHARQIELTQKRITRLAKLEEQIAAYKARQVAFLAARTCECGGYRTLGAVRCLDCWRKDSGLTDVDALSRASHLGVRHKTETREKMGAALVLNWQGEYGERRRAALQVERMVCRKCGFEGDLERFARNPSAYQGRDKICKPCMVIQTRAYKRQAKAVSA